MDDPALLEVALLEVRDERQHRDRGTCGQPLCHGRRRDCARCASGSASEPTPRIRTEPDSVAG